MEPTHDALRSCFCPFRTSASRESSRCGRQQGARRVRHATGPILPLPPLPHELLGRARASPGARSAFLLAHQEQHFCSFSRGARRALDRRPSFLRSTPMISLFAYRPGPGSPLHTHPRPSLPPLDPPSFHDALCPPRPFFGRAPVRVVARRSATDHGHQLVSPSRSLSPSSGLFIWLIRSPRSSTDPDATTPVSVPLLRLTRLPSAQLN